MFVWRIASDTRDFLAEDLSGRGAEKTGGRWNRAGSPIVYCAGSIALACLETVVHLRVAGLPLNRFLVRVDIPDEVWARRQTLQAASLPVGWSAIPEGLVSVEFGQRWLASMASAVLELPSVIVPEENNCLINPRHPDAAGITALKLRSWSYDGRFDRRA